MEFSALFLDKKLYVECPKQSNGEYGLSGSMFFGFGMKKKDGKIWIPKKRLQEFKDTMKSVQDDLKTGEITASYRKFSDFASQLKMLIDMYAKISRAKGVFELTLGEIKDQIITLNAIDPSGKEGTYMRWLVKIEASSGRDYGLNHSVIGPLLKRFDQLRRIPAAKGKFNPDINSYNTVSELQRVIHGLADIKSKKSQEKDWKSTVFSRLSEFGKVNTTSGGYTLVKVDSPDDIIKFCALFNIQKTWCIWQRQQANAYVPIIFIIQGDKIVGNYSVRDESFWDRQDDEMDRPDWIAAVTEVYPEEMVKFFSNNLVDADENGYDEIIKELLNYMKTVEVFPSKFMKRYVYEYPPLSVYYAMKIVGRRLSEIYEDDIVINGTKREIDEYCYAFGLKVVEDANGDEVFRPINKSASYRKLADLESLMPTLIQIYRKHSGTPDRIMTDYQVERLIRRLADNDPTGEKADYARWLVTMSAKCESGALDSMYDMDWVATLLARYDELKRTPRTKEKLSRDISTFKSLEELKAAIDVFHGLTSKKKEKERKLEGVMMNLADWGEVAYVSGGYTILYINDVDTIMSFLRELGITSWCIKDDNYVRDYAPISFIIAPGGKVVANMESSNFRIYNRDDSSLPGTHEYYKLMKESGFMSQMEMDREDIEEEDQEAIMEREAEQSWEEWTSDAVDSVRNQVVTLFGLPGTYDSLPEWQREIFCDLTTGNMGRYIEFQDGGVEYYTDIIERDIDMIHQRLFHPDHPNQMSFTYSKHARYRKF
jgi:hypothetical protein